MSEYEANLIDDWIIILLAVNNFNPIRGRIRFIKNFFLFSINYFSELFEISQFYSYHFGPYSTRFAERVNQLKNQEIIQANYINKDWEYSLTEKGKIKFGPLSKSIQQELIDQTSKIKEKTYKLTLKQLLKEIYTEYPIFAVRSVIRNDIIKEKVNIESLQKIDDSSGFISSTSFQQNIIELKSEASKVFLKLISE